MDVLVQGVGLCSDLKRSNAPTAPRSIVCAFGFAMGGFMGQLRKLIPLLVTFYGLLDTLFPVGPEDCNFLVSSESFHPASTRTLFSLGAAVGKVGWRSA